MLEKIPTDEELRELLGADAHETWVKIVRFIGENYEVEASWDTGRKAGVYEHKFRRSGKTLCALYAREKCFGFMVVFGKAEREKFEAGREGFSPEIQKIYDETHQYHDGKWLMIEVRNEDVLPEIENLLWIKKKPRKDKSKPTV